MPHADDPGTSSRDEDENTLNLRFQFGSVVAAKLGNFPWWPAMVDPSPETNGIHWPDIAENSEDLRKAKRKPTHYHVVFFDLPGKVSRGWVLNSKITPYEDCFSEPLSQSERDAVLNLRGRTNRRRLVEARIVAEAALRTPIDERRKKYSFICTFKGPITVFDEDGNKQVIDGGKTGDGVPAQKAEFPKIKKKRGRKPKAKTPLEPLAAEQKVEPLRISIKLRPEPKLRNIQQSLSGSEIGESRKRRASSTSSSATVPPDNPPTREYSCTKKVARNSSRASPTSSEPDGRSEKRNSAPLPPISHPSSAPRASHELTQELSLLSASFPETSTTDDKPKKRGRKSKKKDEKKPPIGKLRSSKNMPAPEASTSRDTPTVTETTTTETTNKAFSPTSLMPVDANCSRQAPASSTCPRSTPSPSATLPQEPEGTQVSEKEQPKPLVSQDLEPTENSIENQITSFLNRIQTQTPKLRCNGKTIPNLNHLIPNDEARVIDLTSDDDEDSTLRHGEVVFANLKGLQPWPAVIVMDPEINLCFIPATGPPNFVHVVFLHINRRAWVPIENVTMFEDKKFHTKEMQMLNYDKYSCAYDLARKACLHPREHRTRLYGDMESVPMTGTPAVSDEIIIL